MSRSNGAVRTLSINVQWTMVGYNFKLAVNGCHGELLLNRVTACTSMLPTSH